MLINRFFTVFRTAARGMEAQRVRLGAAAENIANATTTRTADGTPYALKRVVQEAPAEQYEQFREMLHRMQSDLQLSRPGHLSGTELGGGGEPADLGPITEVRQELRLRTEYDPTHPHADADGYVQLPDVNVVEEMANMMSANRVYEANLSAVQAAKEMIKRTLEI